MVELVSQIEDLDKKIEMKFKAADQNDIARSQSTLTDLRTLLTDYYKKVNELDNEVQGSDEQNLINKVRGFNNEYTIKKKKIDKLEEKVTYMINNQKFKSGELKGQDLRNAERGAIKELHKETDEQGEIITEIGKDLAGANNDLREAAVEVKKQGDQIVHIHEGVHQADSAVKRTDQNINQMTKRAFCMKFLMIILVVVLFLLDVAFLIWKLLPSS